jgi:RimJ/RimL family protein N-acetyltransferase
MPVINTRIIDPIRLVRLSELPKEEVLNVMSEEWIIKNSVLNTSNRDIPCDEYYKIATKTYDEIKNLETSFGIITEESGYVGNIGLTRYMSKTEPEIFIEISKKHSGKGHGKNSLHIFMQYVFFYKDLERLVARVLRENYPAQGLFRHNGFKEQSVLRDLHYQDGQRHDMTILSSRREDYHMFCDAKGFL